MIEAITQEENDGEYLGHFGKMSGSWGCGEYALGMKLRMPRCMRAV